MFKVECPRCTGGKGVISAFKHVKGGVCFQCNGLGYVMRKTKPIKMHWYNCWTVIDGEGAFRYSLKAPSETQALSKLKKKIVK